MAGQVLWPDVRLGLDNAAHATEVACFVHQKLTQEAASHLKGGSVVEGDI
jgi:hypothetical protein